MSRPSRAKRESADASPPDRVIFRRSDGTLRERDGQRVSIAGLRDQVRAGNRFRAYHEETGAECTYELLIELLGGALLGFTGQASEAGERDTLLHALCRDPESIRSGNGDSTRSRPPRGGR